MKTHVRAFALRLITVLALALVPCAVPSAAVAVQAYTLHLTASAPSAQPGEIVSYTLLVTNTGDEPVGASAAIDLSDVVDDATFANNMTATTGVLVPGPQGSTQWSGTLQPGVTATITFSVTVNNPPAGNKLLSPSVVPGPNGLVTSGPATTTITDVADLSVSKTAPPAAPVGSNFDYTIEVSNAGPGTATNVSLTDTLPSSNVTFVSASTTQGSCSHSSGDVVCSIGSLANAGTATVTITVKAVTAGTAKNDVFVEADQTDSDQTDNFDSATTSIGAASADVSVSKSAQPTATVGDNFDYTIEVSNAGPGTATNVSLTDTLPSSNVTFVSASTTQGTCSHSSGDVVCSIGSLANAGTATVTITVKAVTAGTAKNDVFVEADQTDSDQTDNFDSATTSIAAPPTPVAVPDAYSTDEDTQLIVNAADGLFKNDTNTNGATASIGTATAQGIALVAPDGSFTYTPNTGFTGTDTFTYIASGPGGQSAPATVTITVNPAAPALADLSITKTDGAATVVPGETLTYLVSVSNPGPDDVTGATVSDTMPSVLTNVTWTSVASGGASGNLASGSGDISDVVDLPAGSSVQYTINATLSPGATGPSFANTATVAVPSGVDDLNTADNSATDTNLILAPSTDLSITKTDGVTSVTTGSTVTYTITASNAGPSAATGATVDDVVPAVLSGVTWTCAGTLAPAGLCAGGGTGNISEQVNLDAGASVTFTVTGTLSTSATGPLSNTATVAAPQGATDPDPGNNSATDTDTVVPGDSDGDGLTDAKENAIGTNPTDPDSDNDGLRDGPEVNSSYTCLSPLKKDSEGDLLGDGHELKGVVVGLSYTTNADNPGKRFFVGRVKTNPCKKDGDRDGLSDYREAVGSVINQKVVRYSKDGGTYLITKRKSHPMKRDTDGDGLTDKQEVTGSANWRFDRHKSDPTSADTDWGGRRDGREVFFWRTDPTKANG